jgi:hypothetical protein
MRVVCRLHGDIFVFPFNLSLECWVKMTQANHSVVNCSTHTAVFACHLLNFIVSEFANIGPNGCAVSLTSLTSARKISGPFWIHPAVSCLSTIIFSVFLSFMHIYTKQMFLYIVLQVHHVQRADTKWKIFTRNKQPQEKARWWIRHPTWIQDKNYCVSAFVAIIRKYYNVILR